MILTIELHSTEKHVFSSFYLFFKFIFLYLYYHKEKAQTYHISSQVCYNL